jgi:uncharacterized membrane protein
VTWIYLSARILHVTLGAFWVGAMVFAAFFLMPAIAEAGPDGAKVMAGINRRQYMNILPVVALTNVISGLWLYWRFTNGFDPEISRTPGAMVFGTGGVLALIALHLGLAVVRKNILKAGALMAKVGGMPDGPDKAKLASEAATLRGKAMKAAPIVAVILLLTVALMAIGHYI